MLTRLYFRIYLAVLGSLVVFAFAVGAAWRSIGESTHRSHSIQLLMQAAQNVLPPADASTSWQQLALREITRGMQVDLSLYSANLELLANVGEPLPAPEIDHGRGRFFGQLRPQPVWNMQLPDGRWLRARPAGPPDLPPSVGGAAFIGALLLLLLVVALAAHPIARRITRRLENLQSGVESLGRGDLKARVVVQGHDEVAALAASFNRAAARIEELVASHRLLLANTSHELRTPLTRIRLALELLKDNFEPKRRAALEQDIQELDTLIEGILLNSRLDALPQPGSTREIDLLALAAEECARFTSHDIDVSGAPVFVKGDIALLRRLVRNLVENAIRHGELPIAVTVHSQSGKALLCVSDHGKGVPDDAIDKLFEPFNSVGGTRTSGTGLGLSLVRKIARHHGGDARVKINDSNGFSIEVTI